MIPANTGVDGPGAQPDLILHEEGLLTIGAPVVEAEDRQSIRIELTRIRNPVAETFPDRAGAQVAAGLPLVRTGVSGDRALQVQLSKAAILLRRDRRGRGVRPEARRRVAHHAAHVAQHMRRKNVLVRELSEGFLAVSILPLPGLLLHVLVRHEEAGLSVTHDDTESTRIGEIALEVRGDM